MCDSASHETVQSWPIIGMDIGKVTRPSSGDGRVVARLSSRGLLGRLKGSQRADLAISRARGIASRTLLRLVSDAHTASESGAEGAAGRERREPAEKTPSGHASARVLASTRIAPRSTRRGARTRRAERSLSRARRGAASRRAARRAFARRTLAFLEDRGKRRSRVVTRVGYEKSARDDEAGRRKARRARDGAA